MSCKCEQITSNDCTIAGKCAFCTTNTTITEPEIAGDGGHSDLHGSIADIEPEFAGDWGDSDFHGSITDIEPEFAGDWGDSDFDGNYSGPD